MQNKPPFLSVVICVYNMPREAPRTILSALPPYQKNVTEQDYEVIVVDNGSSQPVDEQFLSGLPKMVKHVRYSNKSVSPVAALNWAAANIATGSHIMFCIDGARIFSERLVAECLKCVSISQRAFIYTLGWHIGPVMHVRAEQTGYNQQVEDQLLTDIDWYQNPERLFEISVLAGSSQSGFFSAITESNAFVVSREMLAELGGFNEGFTSPGGGLCNLEIFERYVTSGTTLPICLLGEGTFHQYHGGVATSGKAVMSDLRLEYKLICGIPYTPPRYSTLFAGAPKKELMKFYTESIRKIKFSLL